MADIPLGLDSQQGANVWLTIALREGKNREVRNILASLELEVNRLIRVSFGPFQLLDLSPGTVEVVPQHVLAEQLGRELAAKFELTRRGDETAVADRRPRRPAARDQHASRHGGERGRERESKPSPDRGERSAQRREHGKARPKAVEIDESHVDATAPWRIKTGPTAPGGVKRPRRHEASANAAQQRGAGKDAGSGKPNSVKRKPGKAQTQRRSPADRTPTRGKPDR